MTFKKLNGIQRTDTVYTLQQFVNFAEWLEFSDTENLETD